MRLNKIFTLFGFCCLALFVFASKIAALTREECGFNCDIACAETSDDVTTCQTGNFYCNSPWIEGCDPGYSRVIRCISQETGNPVNYSPDAPYWTPQGTDDVVCTSTCEFTNEGDGNCGCISEEIPIYCGTPTTAPTSVPTSVPTSAPTTIPTPGTVLISGSLQQDTDAAMSGSLCSQASSAPLSLSGVNLYGSSITNTYPATLTGSDFTINTAFTGSNYSVTLDLSTQSGTNYICSCPAPINPDNPYLCKYTGVSSPRDNVNFYLKEYSLSTDDSWFQVFGGNLFGKIGVATNVPYNLCDADPACQAGLLVPKVGSSSLLSSGFAITNTSIFGDIRSSASSNVYHAYFHQIDRPSNFNAYGISTNLAPLAYNYFYNLAENEIQEIGDGGELSPPLNDWTTSEWWRADEVNYVKVNGNLSIDETKGFYLASNQRLVVFVNGNLTLNDSDPADSSRKITSVAEGGFLAFFVSGNILITPDVGYELNPSSPTVPVVSVTNSNLEGVFVADGELTIESKLATAGTLPDKKFIGSGTFVGWEALNMNRTFDDGDVGIILNNNQAIDNFVYRIDLLANWPTKLKASISNWREIDPQLISQ